MVRREGWGKNSLGNYIYRGIILIHHIQIITLAFAEKNMFYIHVYAKLFDINAIAMEIKATQIKMIVGVLRHNAPLRYIFVI